MDKNQPQIPDSGDRLPRAVIFDMDGVLLLSEPLIRRALIIMFREKGLDVQSDDLMPFTGTDEIYCINAVAKKYNFSIDAQQARNQVYQIYYRLIEGKLKPLPGALDFLDKCRRLGKKLAVASNTEFEKLCANFDAVGFDIKMFDAIVTGSEVANKKPSPDLFFLAAEKLSVKANQCLVVEDAVAGIVAAHAAGARCLALTTTFGADELTDADWLADDLTTVDPQVLDW